MSLRRIFRIFCSSTYKLLGNFYNRIQLSSGIRNINMGNNNSSHQRMSFASDSGSMTANINKGRGNSMKEHKRHGIVVVKIMNAANNRRNNNHTTHVITPKGSVLFGSVYNPNIIQKGSYSCLLLSSCLSLLNFHNSCSCTSAATAIYENSTLNCLYASLILTMVCFIWRIFQY